MKKDILGREINENDVVVVKGNYGCDMEIGVFIGKSVRTINGPKHAEDMFLVENPGSKELAIKKDILDKLAKERAAATVAKAKKATQKANVPGTIYQMSKDDELFLYCGKCLLTIYKDGAFAEQESGHLYLTGGRWFSHSPATTSGMTFNHFKAKTQERMYFSYASGWSLTQSVKKYKATYNQIEVPATFTLENYWTSTDFNGIKTNHTYRCEVAVLAD
jgi:hypothetical protein